MKADPWEIIEVTDEAEKDSIRSDSIMEIIGTIYPDGKAEAYRWTVERFRARRAVTSVGTVHP